jgi:hypothetical protein
MSLPPSKQFIQDMPPVGGFVRPPGFPAEAFRKRSPARGPGGALMLAGAAGLTLWGMLRFLGDVEERKCVPGGPAPRSFFPPPPPFLADPWAPNAPPRPPSSLSHTPTRTSTPACQLP